MKKLFIILLAAGFIQSNQISADTGIITPKYTDMDDIEKHDPNRYPHGYENQITMYNILAQHAGADDMEVQKLALQMNWLVENIRSVAAGNGKIQPPELLTAKKYNDTEKFFQGVGRFVKGAVDVVKESTQAGISAVEKEIHKELDRPEHQIDSQLKNDIKNMVTHLGNTANEGIENSSNAAGEIAEHGINQLVDHAAGHISEEELKNNVQNHAQEQLDELNEKSIDMAGKAVTNISYTTGSILTNPSIASAAQNDGSEEAMIAAQLSAEAGQALMDNAGVLGETVTSVGQQANELGKAFREESESYFNGDEANDSAEDDSFDNEEDGSFDEKNYSFDKEDYEEDYLDID